MDDEAFARLVLPFILRLTRHGWRVGVDRADGGYRVVSFTHPVAVELFVNIREDDSIEGTRRQLEHALSSHRDFSLTEQPPDQWLHPLVMRHLRAAAAEYGWAPEVLRQVLLALLGASCITSDEAEWVLMAGPAVMKPGAKPWMPPPLFQ